MTKIRQTRWSKQIRRKLDAGETTIDLEAHAWEVKEISSEHIRKMSVFLVFIGMIDAAIVSPPANPFGKRSSLWFLDHCGRAMVAITSIHIIIMTTHRNTIPQRSTLRTSTQNCSGTRVSLAASLPHQAAHQTTTRPRASL